jgi:hypothetical protein
LFNTPTMIVIDKEQLQEARIFMDAHRHTLSDDSQAAPKMEFISELCRKIYFALDDEGAVLIQQQEGGNNEMGKTRESTG